MDLVKRKRAARVAARMHELTDERLEVRELVATAKLKQKERDL